MADSSIYDTFASALEKPGWRFSARPDQLPHFDDDWAVWALIGGRSAGKTRAGAEAVREGVESGRYGRIGLIAPTSHDCREVMLQGPSGLITISDATPPRYEPSLRKITWENGAVGFLYSAEEADRLRGPQHDLLWCDEVAAWPNVQSVWDMSQFGLRVGKKPRAIVTTTPRPTPFLKNLLKRKGQDLRLTHCRTIDNAENLPKAYLDQMERQYAGTRLGRQELDAELLEDVQGSLWPWPLIEASRKPCHVSVMERVVVALDASGARGADDEAADSIGIIIAGKGVDGRAYVMADRSCKLSPAGWGRRAVEAYHEFNADRLVGERNYGGAMIEYVVRTVDRNISYKEVTATRGKVARSEPAALYEQGKISHLGDLSALESQMSAMTSEGYQGDGSPDRVDALVWALHELMLERQRPVFCFG